MHRKVRCLTYIATQEIVKSGSVTLFICCLLYSMCCFSSFPKITVQAVQCDIGHQALFISLASFPFLSLSGIDYESEMRSECPRGKKMALAF